MKNRKKKLRKVHIDGVEYVYLPMQRRIKVWRDKKLLFTSSVGTGTDEFVEIIPALVKKLVEVHLQFSKELEIE